MNTSREFYEETYHFDEDIAVVDEKRNKHFFKYVHLCGSCTFLDIGCGVGWALKYCAEKGMECYGFDISTKAIKLARRMLNPDIKLMVADGEKLPFADGSFDVVSSLGTLEHFTSPARGLVEIQRVTKKNGRILLVVPNSYWILNRLNIYTGTEQPSEMVATLAEWSRFIHKHGLVIEKISKDLGPKIFKNRNAIGILKRVLLKCTILLPTSFAYQFIFLCRK
jgi:SAM-dependent methyltransferase